MFTVERRRLAMWRRQNNLQLNRKKCNKGFLHRGVRAGYRRVDEPTATQLIEDFDDHLFHRVQHVSCHSLQPVLPNHRYVLRDRRCDFVLPCRLTSLTDYNFIIRQKLFMESYWCYFLVFNVFQVVAVCLTTLINEYVCIIRVLVTTQFLWQIVTGNGYYGAQSVDKNRKLWKVHI